MITIRDLVIHNREALDNGTLQALHNAGACLCLYQDAEGYSCAVGVTMSRELCEIADQDGWNAWSVDMIVKDQRIQVENLFVFRATQQLHDSWGMHRVQMLETWHDGYSEKLAEAYDAIKEVNEQSFRGWLDAVEAHFA